MPWQLVTPHDGGLVQVRAAVRLQMRRPGGSGALQLRRMDALLNCRARTRQFGSAPSAPSLLAPRHSPQACRCGGTSTASCSPCSRSASAPRRRCGRWSASRWAPSSRPTTVRPRSLPLCAPGTAAVWSAFARTPFFVFPAMWAAAYRRRCPCCDCHLFRVQMAICGCERYRTCAALLASASPLRKIPCSKSQAQRWQRPRLRSASEAGAAHTRNAGAVPGRSTSRRCLNCSAMVAAAVHPASRPCEQAMPSFRCAGRACPARWAVGWASSPPPTLAQSSTCR